MKIPKNATCQNEAERDQTGKIKTMFSICVACERPGANTWRRKICIFCKLARKTMRRKPSKTVELPKKTGLTKKKTRKPSNCVIAVLNMFLHVFTKKMVSLQGICFFTLLMAGFCNLYIVKLAFAGSGVPASSSCETFTTSSCRKETQEKTHPHILYIYIFIYQA